MCVGGGHERRRTRGSGRENEDASLTCHGVVGQSWTSVSGRALTLVARPSGGCEQPAGNNPEPPSSLCGCSRGSEGERTLNEITVEYMVYYMDKIKQGGGPEGLGMHWTRRQRKKW